jgi:ribose 5-phosphate isomerase B
MTIAIGSDHAGFELKEKVRIILQSLGHGVIDYGTHSRESVDYPDFGVRVARATAANQVDRGIVICGTGNGMTIVANKIKGVRATLCLNRDMAYFARRHNDSNVLALSQKYTDQGELEDILKTWLETEYEGGRHVARLEKIKKIEEEQ